MTLFLVFVLRYLVSGVCYRLLYLSPVCLFWVCWVRGNFLWRAGSYFFCVCDSAVWSAGPVHFLFRHSVGADGGTVQIFPFLWLCCSGYGTVEMVRGGGLSFSSLSLVCCQFSWWLDVRGRILCSIN